MAANPHIVALQREPIAQEQIALLTKKIQEFPLSTLFSSLPVPGVAQINSLIAILDKVSALPKDAFETIRDIQKDFFETVRVLIEELFKTERVLIEELFKTLRTIVMQPGNIIKDCLKSMEHCLEIMAKRDIMLEMIKLTSPNVPLSLKPQAIECLQSLPVTFFLFLDDRDIQNLSVYIVGINGDWGKKIPMHRIGNTNAYSCIMDLATDKDQQIKYKTSSSETEWLPTGEPTDTNIKFFVPGNTAHRNHIVASYQSSTANKVRLRHNNDWDNGITLIRKGEGSAPVHTTGCVPFDFNEFRFFRDEWRPEGDPRMANFRSDNILAIPRVTG